MDEDTADDANTDANRSAQLSDEAARKGNGTVGAPLVVDNDESDRGTEQADDRVGETKLCMH